MTGKQAVMVILGVSALLGSTDEALHKAAAQTPKSVINGAEIAREDAEVLRTTSHVRPIEVVVIDGSDPTELLLTFRDLQTKTAYRTLFREADRQKLFQAFEDRSEIWVEYAVQEAQGKIRSIEILRIADPPN